MDYNVNLIQQEITLPTISMFYGIIIRMCFAPVEHPPPHFLAYYGEYTVVWTLGPVS